MMLAILTALLLTVLAAVYIYFKRRFALWKTLGFPHTKNPLFIWGDAKGVGQTRSLGVVLNEIYNEFPKERFVGCFIFWRPHILLRDPDLIKRVLVKDFATFPSRGMYYNETKDPISAHLFLLEPPKWRIIRPKLSPTFTSGKIKGMFPIFVHCCEQLATVLDGPASRGEVISVKDYTARFTTDIISLTAFGIEVNSLQNPTAEFRHYGHKFFNLSRFEALRMMVPEITQLLRFPVINKEVSNFFFKVFGESVVYREQNNIKRDDFLDLLMQLMNKGKVDGDGDASSKLTFEEAAAQAFVFFVAGFETSSTTMQFALYELAKNPTVQEKAREEIKRVLAKHNGEISYECLLEMDYLKKVIDETLRMYPPAPFLQRKSVEDWEMPGTGLTVPKGTYMAVDVLGLHHDEKHFPNPEKFDPDRFTEEAKASRHPYVYLPFGEGLRNCIGMRFGLMQSRLGIMTLLNNYKFSVSKETAIPMVYNPKTFFLNAAGGMDMRINRI